MLNDKTKKELSQEQQNRLLEILTERFKSNMNRHKGVEWAHILAKLEANPSRFWPLNEMEISGGEPDVIGYNKETDEYIFFDCAKESPKDRRSLCYDREALDSRKEHKPKNSATEMAAEIGVNLLTEEEYKELQMLGDFDTKTSSWILTPPKIRKLGGAVFADRRYDTVFVYHNGAESYYASRGFRGSVRI